jgi:eukaryotic-like serine/threonine-protein kinase
MSDREAHDASRRRAAGTRALGSPEAEGAGAGEGAIRHDRELEARPVVPGVGTEEPRDEDNEMIGVVVDERYRIQGFLGRGAMGSVYRAEHVIIRRQVALKLLHPALVTIPEIAARFEREAFAIGRIDHPNCVGVSDFGRLEDGSLYLALELVHGRPLADVLDNEGRLEPRRALRIARHVLRGLAHAHRAGIVHRDVKPGNVVLTERDGDPDFAKVLDFGIAKLEGQAETVEGGEKLTQAGIACGTPSYMAPEQVVGDSADARSDVYAVGIMLFELIAGRPPFDDDDQVAILAMHTTKPPPSLAEAASDVQVPLGTETLLRRALEKRREDRFDSAEAMIEAIDACLDDGASASRRKAEDGPGPTDEPEQPPKPSRRVHPEAATVLATRAGRAMTELVARNRRVKRIWPVLACVALVLGLGGWWFLVRDPRPSKVAIAAAVLLERGNPAGALAALDRHGDSIADDPHAQLQRGHAYAARREYALAVEAYERALALRRASRDDPVLQTNLELLLDVDDPDVVLPAIALLVRVLEDAAAVERLLDLASASTHTELRHGALALAETLGLDDAVDRTRSFALDLRQAEACDERRDAVARLRALGDPEAVTTLRSALQRDDNACLHDDAAEAIRYLDALQRRTVRDAAPAPE